MSMTPQEAIAWLKKQKAIAWSQPIADGAWTDAIAALEPLVPKPRYQAYNNGQRREEFGIWDNLLMYVAASGIPTRDQAERIAAIYNEEADNG